MNDPKKDDSQGRLSAEEIKLLKEFALNLKALSRTGRLIKYMSVSIGGVVIFWWGFGEKIIIFFKKGMS